MSAEDAHESGADDWFFGIEYPYEAKPDYSVEDHIPEWIELDKTGAFRQLLQDYIFVYHEDDKWAEKLGQKFESGIMSADQVMRSLATVIVKDLAEHFNLPAFEREKTE